ncbi:hypothetical protein [Spirosoma aerophilum]
MGRNANPLTGTQQDPKAFAKIVADIRSFGLRTLAGYGLVSHETIKQYALKRAVRPESEEAIQKSIDMHKKELANKREQSIARTKELYLN